MVKKINTEEKEKAGKVLKNFARFTGIGFQMVAVIGLFTFIGYQIDKSRNNKELIFTAILGLLGVLLALYQAIRGVLKS